MVEKLRSILKNPRFILAYKGFLFGIFFAAHLVSGGWWTVVYFLGAGFMFFRPFIASSSLAFLFIVFIFVSFMTPISGIPIAIFVGLYSFLFMIILGVNNFTLTYRGWWIYVACVALWYLLMLNFFLRQPTDFFWGWWFITIILAGGIAYAMFQGRAIPTGFILVLTSELIWIVSWLPIGFLSSAALLLLVFLFISDAVIERQLRWRNIFLFSFLLAVILLTSYWQL